jgi:hypothetical protein
MSKNLRRKTLCSRSSLLNIPAQGTKLKKLFKATFLQIEYL